jgi:hypothetical protein
MGREYTTNGIKGFNYQTNLSLLQHVHVTKQTLSQAFERKALGVTYPGL